MARRVHVRAGHEVPRAGDGGARPLHHVGLAQEVGQHDELGHQNNLRNGSNSHGSVRPPANLGLLVQFVPGGFLGQAHDEESMLKGYRRRF